MARDQLQIDWQGAHGANHWARVPENGLKLAAITGAKVEVVELFALLHDTQRENEYVDPEHADRLDLGRVGIKPIPSRLCTEAARSREMIAWAYDRSIRWRYE